MAKVITLIINGNKINFQSVNDVNVQKKIEPQIRLYSTKKKTVQKDSISKPSMHEINSIVKGLENKKNETINIHNTFDHTYM